MSTTTTAREIPVPYTREEKRKQNYNPFWMATKKQIQYDNMCSFWKIALYLIAHGNEPVSTMKINLVLYIITIHIFKFGITHLGIRNSQIGQRRKHKSTHQYLKWVPTHNSHKAYKTSPRSQKQSIIIYQNFSQLYYRSLIIKASLSEPNYRKAS